MRTAAKIVPFLLLGVFGTLLPAQAEDRDALAARLKARVDERLADMVVQLRAELHREIDVALAGGSAPSGRLDRLIDDLRGPAATGDAGGSRSAPAGPGAASKSTAATPSNPRSRSGATQAEPSAIESDGAARARLDALTKRVADLEASGAPAEIVASLRTRLEGVRSAIENRTESPPAAPTQPSRAPDSRPVAQVGDDVFKQAWDRAMRAVIDGRGTIETSPAGGSSPGAPESRPSQKNSQSQTTGGVGKLGSESRSH